MPISLPFILPGGSDPGVSDSHRPGNEWTEEQGSGAVATVWPVFASNPGATFAWRIVGSGMITRFWIRVDSGTPTVPVTAVLVLKQAGGLAYPVCTVTVAPGLTEAETPCGLAFVSGDDLQVEIKGPATATVSGLVRLLESSSEVSLLRLFPTTALGDNVWVRVGGAWVQASSKSLRYSGVWSTVGSEYVDNHGTWSTVL